MEFHAAPDPDRTSLSFVLLRDTVSPAALAAGTISILEDAWKQCQQQYPAAARTLSQQQQQQLRLAVSSDPAVPPAGPEADVPQAPLSGLKRHHAHTAPQGAQSFSLVQ